MEKEFGAAPGFTVGALGVPLRLLCARPSSSVSIRSDPCNLSWMWARRQPSLQLQGWKKSAINMQSIIPAGLRALPLLEAQVTVVALCSVAIPLSCSRAFPLCHLSVLKGFFEDPWFSALKRPAVFSPRIPVNLFCPLRGKKILSKNMVFRGRCRNNCSNTKSSLELWSLMGLCRSWRVA